MALFSASSIAFLAISFFITTVPALHLERHDTSFTPDYSLHVTMENASIACRSRPTALVNGSTPGPPVTLYENRTTWVRVYNDMPSTNLTMHWHGLSQSVSQFSDGTPQASQWPIAANHYFDYELHPDVGEAGTYFYHSHVGFQAVSAAGPLIVREPQGQLPPYEYDEEKILFVSELFNKTDEMVESGLSAAELTWSGEAEMILANGKAFEPVLTNQEEFTPPPYTSPPSHPLACGPEVFHVKPDTTYRFRSIGGSALSIVAFAFEQHPNLTVIAADAHYTLPSETPHIQIGSGQRYDFLLHTKSAAEINRLGRSWFWIEFDGLFRPVNITSYAVLQYDMPAAPTGNATFSAPPSKKPVSIPALDPTWLEYTLEPLHEVPLPPASAVSRTVYLYSRQLLTHVNGANGTFWSVNNRTWTETNEHLHNVSVDSRAPNVGVPYLVDVYKRGEAAVPDFTKAAANNGYDADLNVYAAQVGEIIDIIIIGEPNGQPGGFDPHPWHTHGAAVWDIGSGPGLYNATANEAKLKGYKPVLRDSTILYKYTLTDDLDTTPYTPQGWRAWRLNVSDPGVWMVHCHTLQHMILGMQTVWAMGNASQITKHPEPFVQGYLDFGGSAYGNASYDPLVMHTF